MGQASCLFPLLLSHLTRAETALQRGIETKGLFVSMDSDMEIALKQRRRSLLC
jgi:hypothetical protein